MAKKAPTTLRIIKVRRSRKSITIHYRNGDEDHEITSRDMPLPAFVSSLDALVPVVLSICGLQDGYAENLTVSGFTLTDKGMVTLQAKKSLPDASGPLNIATPLRFLDLPKQEGSYTPPLTDIQAQLINDAEEEAKSYVKGDRAQGQLPLEKSDDDAPEGDDNVEQGEFAGDNGSTGKPAKKKR